MHHAVAASASSWSFAPQFLPRVEEIFSRYPSTTAGRRSALIPLLHLAQEQTAGSFLTQDAMVSVGELCGVRPSKVHEVASFYSMFRTEPVGEHKIEVCTGAPCMLRGADERLAAILAEYGLAAPGQTTADGKVTVLECECLGACCNAPVITVDDVFFEDVASNESAVAVAHTACAPSLKGWKGIIPIVKGLFAKQATPGSQIGRVSCE
jgi:NADH:ubiquinone oxidoreductase subunit E